MSISVQNKDLLLKNLHRFFLVDMISPGSILARAPTIVMAPGLKITWKASFDGMIIFISLGCL